MQQFYVLYAAVSFIALIFSGAAVFVMARAIGRTGKEIGKLVKKIGKLTDELEKQAEANRKGLPYRATQMLEDLIAVSNKDRMNHALLLERSKQEMSLFEQDYEYSVKMNDGLRRLRGGKFDES